jgi:hypothetical protein
MLVLASATRPLADEIRGYGIAFEPRLSIGEDFQLGGRLGYAIRTWEGRTFAAFLDGEIRPVPEEVRVRRSPTFEYQYQETRGSIGPGISMGKSLSETLTVSLAAGLAYTDGFYWGSNRAPRSDWTPWAEAGFRCFLADHTYWGAAVQYRQLPDNFPARMLLEYGFYFGEGLSP